MGKFHSPRVVPRERVRSPKFESRRGKLLRDGCACAARVKLGMRNVRRVHVTDIWSWYRVELRVGDHLGRSEELVSRCVECDLAEPESLASLGGSAPGVVDGILSPYHQHQNKAENRFGLAKRYTNTVMNTSGCTACCWLLCLQYICVVLNHLASPTLQGICPVQALEGTTPDISFLLHFSFYEPVYYRIDSSEPDLNFPSSSNEKKGYWVGFADNQGDSPTWRILTEDTQKIIIRSGVRSALRTTTNQRLASPSGEGTTLPFPIPYSQQSQNSLPLDPLDASTPNFEHFVKSQTGEDEDNPIPMANIDIPNLLGRSFLLPPEDNGECHMAKVIDIDDHGQTLEDIKFKLKISKDQAEEIMSYNQLMDYIQKGTDAEEDPDSLFKFRDIVAHQGPLESTDPNHKGANTMLWLNGNLGRSLMNP